MRRVVVEIVVGVLLVGCLALSWVALPAAGAIVVSLLLLAAAYDIWGM